MVFLLEVAFASSVEALKAGSPLSWASAEFEGDRPPTISSLLARLSKLHAVWPKDASLTGASVHLLPLLKKEKSPDFILAGHKFVKLESVTELSDSLSDSAGIKGNGDLETMFLGGLVSGSRIVVVLPKLSQIAGAPGSSIKSPVEDSLSLRSNKALEKRSGESLLLHVYQKLQWQLKGAFFAESKYNRHFKITDHNFVKKAKETFATITLTKLEKIPPPKKKRTNVFTLPPNNSGKYTSKDFDEIEIDCLIKIPVPAGMKSETIWSKPIEANSSMNSLQFITNGKPVALSESEVPSTKYPQPVRKPVPSSFSDQMYGEGCTHYIVGESYFPFKKEPSPELKLVQMERILRVLLTKETQRVRKDITILECVFGVVFIGPTYDEITMEKIGHTVEHYNKVLPLLHKLMVKKRLLACFHQDIVTNGVEIAMMSEKIANLEVNLEKITEETNKKLDILLKMFNKTQ